MLAQACLGELRTAYDEAFEHWRIEVRFLRSSELGGNPRLRNDLLQRVEQAERAYRQTRNELADFLIAQHPTAAAASKCC